MQEPREILKEMQKLGHEIMEVTEQLAEAEYGG